MKPFKVMNMSEIKVKTTMGQVLDLDGKDKPYRGIADRKKNKNPKNLIGKLRKRIKELEKQIVSLGG
jgi:hypothetical protein